MTAALTLLSLGFIAYALLHIHDRPGLFGGVTVCAYGFATYFGGIGGAAGVLALLVALARLAQRPDRPPLAAEAALALWAALTLVAACYAVNGADALRGVGFLVAFAVSGYVYGRAFGDTPHFGRDLAIGAGLSLALCEPGFLLHLDPVAARMSGEATATGASLLVDVPMVACLTLLILGDRLRPAVTLAAAALLLAVTAIALSFGTRGVFVGAGAAALIAIVRRLRAPRAGRFVLRLAALAGGGAAIGLVALWRLAGTAPQFLNAASRLTSNLTPQGIVADPASLARLAFWRQAWAATLEAPLFGHGPFAFGTLASYAGGATPHNMFLEILVSTGFVGLVLFAAGFVPIVRAGARAMFAAPLDLGTGFAAALAVDAIVRQQVSFSVLSARTLFLALGMVVARAYPAPRAAAEAWPAPPRREIMPR